MANLSNINNKFIVADVATATRVSIGITTTNNLLTLFGTGAGNATLQIEGEGGADPYINFLANNAQHWSLGIDDSDSDKFKLSEHSALGTNDYFVVNTSGNVGIGTDLPTYRLEVKSTATNTALFTTSNTVTCNTYFGHTAISNNTNIILYSNAGNLQMWKSGTAASGWGGAKAFNIYNSDGAIAFHPSGNANAMFINTDSKVGIGATDPVKKLDVRGQLAISNSASSYWYMDRNDSTGNFEILTDTNSSVFNIDTSGNVGIGGGAINSPTSVGTFLNITGRNGIGGGTAGIVLKDYDNAGWDIWNSGGILNFRYNNGASGAGNGLSIDTASNATFSGNVRISKTDATLQINNSTASLTNADLYISVEDTGQADIRQYGAYPLAFWTNNDQRLTISSLGVVSVGTTSPITDPFISTNQFQQLQVGKSGVMGSYTNSAGEAMFANNIYVGSTYNTFQAIDTTLDGFGVFCYNTSIQFKFADTQSNGTQSVSSKLTVDSASVTVNEGDLFLGATSSKSGTAYFWSNANDSRMSIANTGSAFELRATYLSTAGYKPIDFYTSDSLRMRITSGGNVLIGTTGLVSSYDAHAICRDSPSGYALIVKNSNTSTTNNTVMQLNRVETTATTGGYALIYRQGSASTGTNRWFVYANGNIVNTNNSYGALSDERKKENIVDATPKLDDLMKVKVRNFNLKGEETKQIGVVAQELEEVFPSMIDEAKEPDSEDETLYKSVKYSVFVPMLIKSIQELKADNDILKSRIETLENK